MGGIMIALVASVIAVLVGYAVPSIVGRGVGERFPNWIGVVAAFLTACLAGGVALLLIAFGGGWLFDLILRASTGYRLDDLSWIQKVLGLGTWFVLLGAAIGAFRGRRRATARSAALAELERMKTFKG